MMQHLPILFLCLLASPLTSLAHTYLQVICEPGVQIYLNDELKGTSNWSDGGLHLKISAGDYQVKATKAGFTPQQTSISLKKSDVKVWELSPFTPIKGNHAKAKSPTQAIQQQYGSLTIHSNPPQCQITLVSASKSKASWPKKKERWHAQRIPAGKYTVKAKARGKTLSYDLEIHPDGDAVLFFDFRAGAASLRSVF